MIPDTGTDASRRLDGGCLSLAGMELGLDSVLFPPVPSWSDSYQSFLSSTSCASSQVRFGIGAEDRRPDDSRFVASYGMGAWQRGEMDGRLLYRFQSTGGQVFLWAEPNDSFESVEIWLGADVRGGVPPLQYPVDRVLCMGLLAHQGGVIVHSCGWTCNGQSLLFPGVSGAGKSTLCRQLMATGRGSILSDDRIIVKEDRSEFSACGTPWPGDALQARNESAPLTAMCFIEKSPEHRLVPIRPTEALRRLLEVASVPWFASDLRDRVLPLLERLVTSVPSYRLDFHPEPGVVDVLLPLVEDSLPQNG